MNILTPPHAALAICWITAYQPIIFFLCLSKSVSSSGFVNMSAICSPVATSFIVLKDFTMDLAWLCTDLDPFLLSLL